MPIANNTNEPFKGIPGSRAIKADLTAAADSLQFNRLFGGPGTIAESGQVRIDVQGVWGAGPGKNIQAQVGRGTIAALRVANSLGAAQGQVHQDAVVQAVRAALIDSYNDGLWHVLTGTSP